MLRYIWIILAIFYPPCYVSAYQAVIKDAVVGASIRYPSPASPSASGELISCRRAHQLLYNDVVECVKERGDSVKIDINSLIYGFKKDTKQPSRSF